MLSLLALRLRPASSRSAETEAEPDPLKTPDWRREGLWSLRLGGLGLLSLEVGVELEWGKRVRS